MNSKKLYFALIGVLVLLGIGTLASVSEANSILEGQSKTLVHAKAADAAANMQKVQLATDKKDVLKYTELNQIAQSVVPQDKDQAAAVREIVALANQSGIPRLSSIAFPPSTLGAVTKSKTATSQFTQVSPVKGIPGVYDLQITVTQSGQDTVPYGNFVSFLSKLEQNRRTALVSSISVQPDPKSPGVVGFILVIDEYIRS